MSGIGMATHWMLPEFRTPISACGMVNPHYKTRDHKQVDCWSCRGTKAFRNHLKEMANSKLDHKLGSE